MKLLSYLVVFVAIAVGSASAATIQYNTIGSHFTGAGFTSGSGTATAQVFPGASTDTLTYVGTSASYATTPSNVSFGSIQNTYIGVGLPITIPAFTFTLVINNVTDGTTASFIGTAAAAQEGNLTSTLVLNWSPTPLSDGTVQFTINTPTSIPANGSATLQGDVKAATATNPAAAVPEPGSMVLLGAGLIGLGFSARNKFTRRG